MSKMYYIGKKIYHKFQSVPVLGRLMSKLSPIASNMLMKIDSLKLHHDGETQKEIEILGIGLVSLQNSVKKSILQTQEQIADYRAQIDIYRERLEFVRLEILENSTSSIQKTQFQNEKIKPEIINSEKYNTFLDTGNVLVNIGCGHKPIAKYLNVDRRNLPGVDIVAEAIDLPFASGTVSEIYTAHLVEHFSLATLKRTVFPYWLGMLSPQGILKVIVPDMPAMISAYATGEMSFSDLSEVTFGAQDYDDDFHFAMFSPQSLQNILVSCGFKYTEIIDGNRVNGKCREMEIWARKF